jgi:hypothetical protein
MRSHRRLYPLANLLRPLWKFCLGGEEFGPIDPAVEASLENDMQRTTSHKPSFQATPSLAATALDSQRRCAGRGNSAQTVLPTNKMMRRCVPGQSEEPSAIDKFRAPRQLSGIQHSAGQKEAPAYTAVGAAQHSPRRRTSRTRRTASTSCKGHPARIIRAFEAPPNAGKNATPTDRSRELTSSRTLGEVQPPTS